MSRRIDPKCEANTLKPANSKRPIEEISQCTRFALSGSRFCKNHQNLHQLTDEQLQNNTRICRGCKKHQYFVDMSYQICDACRDRGASNREKKRDEKIIFPPCVICGFVGGNDRQFVNYCNKHVTDGKKADIEAHGMKWCKGIIRGCPDPELSKDYPYERCEVCRHKENEQDKQRYEDKLRQTVDSLNNTYSINLTKHKITPSQGCDDKNMIGKKIVIKLKPKLSENEIFDKIYIIDGVPHKVCSYPKHYELHSLVEFLSHDGKMVYNEWNETHLETLITLTELIEYMYDRIMIKRFCQDIRTHQKIATNRYKVNQHGKQKSYKDKKEVIEMRKKWHNENSNKIRQCWRKIHNHDKNQDLITLSTIDDQQKENDKLIKVSDEHKKSPQHKFLMYKMSARSREKVFSLTFEQSERFFRGKCVYCGQDPHEDYLHGIDRLYNEIGYEYDNCVSCCEMCNYLKRDLHPVTFIKICENILIYQGFSDKNQYNDVMFNMQHAPYTTYIKNAHDRHRVFDITLEQFDDICSQSCYLCGRDNNQPFHSNGIDRYNNDIGYIIDNCKPCCGVCNFIKGRYTFEEMIQKLQLISQNNTIHDICTDEIKKKYDTINMTKTDGSLMTLNDWELVAFSYLNDEDLASYKPPTEFATIHKKWQCEINRRSRGGSQKIQKSKIDYSKLNPNIMTVEELQLYMPPHAMEGLYKLFMHELEKRLTNAKESSQI